MDRLHKGAWETYWKGMFYGWKLRCMNIRFFMAVTVCILLGSWSVFLSGGISVEASPSSNRITEEILCEVNMTPTEIYVRELCWTSELVVSSFLRGQWRQNGIHRCACHCSPAVSRAYGTLGHTPAPFCIANYSSRNLNAPALELKSEDTKRRGAVSVIRRVSLALPDTPFPRRVYYSCKNRYNIIRTLSCMLCNFREKNKKRNRHTISRAWFRSTDLWVMGPARFHCATLLVDTND